MPLKYYPLKDKKRDMEDYLKLLNNEITVLKEDSRSKCCEKSIKYLRMMLEEQGDP